jgi:S1-C subfamily serine protease
MFKKLVVLLLTPALGCAVSIESLVRKTDPKVVKIGVVLADGRHGSGSGVFIDSVGTVLTCAHVVSHTSLVKLFVKKDDEKVGTGFVIKIDVKRDLALIATDFKKTPYVKLGRPAVRGQQVVLFGSPLGIQRTITVGWIENILDEDKSIPHTIVLQSAATNPGNSGGPLVNLKGRLVGLG